MPSKSLAALREMVGESRLTVVDLAVEAGKVEEFARAVKDDNPAHRSEEAAREQGYRAVPAPLTFVRTADFDRYRPEGFDPPCGFDLGFPDEHRIHGEQEYEYERPLYVGDVLQGTTTLTDVYQREGDRGGTMTFAEHETVFRDQDDETVLAARHTSIETEGAIVEEP
ncbi:MaoC family dehydratase N-terminal domain-containing protein [Halobium palmae]|uniref:MaoC family dehydratase N-terminal domain-containing protein n=1 Tax=Halobium palmae TaxID=1776492 RepID=A0ABD5RYD5_9EURY